MMQSKKYLQSLLLAACLSATPVFAQQATPADPTPATTGAPKGQSEEARMEYKANDMLNKGLELLEAKQTERGIKMVASVPQMFPKSKSRFKAFMALGKYHASQRNFELAVKQFDYLNDSEDPDLQAEGLYQTGISFYNLASYDKAFMAFRRVTNEFPWSVFANESYYYIGQCHFKLGRWSKAVEALEMVGTSVDPDAKSAVAESGQRLYVKVYDKDLQVLRNAAAPAIPTTPAPGAKTQAPPTAPPVKGAAAAPSATPPTTAPAAPASTARYQVLLTTKSGDKETITIEALGRSGEYYIGSLPTAPGEAKPGDGILETIGADVVTVEYIDQNTESGKLNQKKISTVQMASTAVVGFTDGAYREYTKGVFGDTEAFLRVKDLDRDTTNKPDKLEVRVYGEFKQQKEQQAADKTGVNLEEQAEEQTVVRDSVVVTLTETGDHTGVFVGTIIPKVVTDPKLIVSNDPTLSVMKGDDIVIEYVDELNANGPDKRTVKSTAKLLIGQIQDVKVEHRVVDSLDLKSRKNLIEAKIFLKLGQIFKEVGLINKANEKANEGLDRVQDVISTSLRASLDRSIVEDAFSVKWDLLLVQDKLNEAIEVCRSLTELFPDSSLVDKALLKIGMARMESETPGDAIGIFSAVTNLPKSQLKAEAQFHIGEVLERIATLDAERDNRPPNLSSAMQSYKVCAEQYPESPYAGDSLDRIANYYINSKDYARAVELMERVTQDYPDAAFLDKMLLKWVIASYRMGNFPLAKEKADQLLSEYPNSKSAEKAKSFLEIINKKLGSGGGGGATDGAAGQ